MSKTLEFWFDFSCPYAYLASRCVEALAERTGATLELRPFLLGGVFRALDTPQVLFKTLSPAKARHNGRDMFRWADLLDVPLSMPSGHPFRTVTALRALLAVGEPFGPLMHRFFHAYWVDGANLGDTSVVSAILEASGHDAAKVLERAQSPEIKQALFDCTDTALERGVFGAPALVVEGDPVLFWGQDRLDQVERALGGSPKRVVSAAAFSGDVAPVDFYFDFSSPFAYLAAMRVNDVLGAAARWKPMLLGAVFKAVGQVNLPMGTLNQPKRRWTVTDLTRQAADADLPLKWPTNFPLNSVLALRVLLCSGALNGEGGVTPPAGIAFIQDLFRAYWEEGYALSDPKVVAAIATAHGHDGAHLVANARDAKQMLFEATQQAVEAGVFGAPSFVVRGPERQGLFWGADRLDMVARAARGQFALL